MPQQHKRDLQNELEDLSYELNIVLEAMLLYAGAKREKLEDLVRLYIDKIDEILENSQKEGVYEILEVVEYLKTHHNEFFIS